MTHTMNMTYRSKKQITKLMTNSSQLLTILMSKLRVCLEAAWSMPRVCLEYAYTHLIRKPYAISVRARRTASPLLTDQESAPYGLFRTLLLLVVMLVMGVGEMWGQETTETDYSGTYYIASKGSTYSGENNATNNFYLCPTENWRYYDATDGITSENNGKPFMTTYKCRDGSYESSKAIWIIEKAQNSEYYYIKHIDGNKTYYLTHNGSMPKSTGIGANRIRLHLDESPSNNDALFEITYVSSKDCYDIAVTNAPNANKYLNINKGDKNYTYGKDNPEGGVDLGGTIGVWEGGSSATSGQNSQWYLENAVCAKPQVGYDPATHELTFSSTTTGATIKYTLDDTDPTTVYDDNNKPTITGRTVVKAFASKTQKVDSEIVTQIVVVSPGVSTVESIDYSGSPLEPPVTVLDGETEIPAEEYEVVYSYNTDIGPATAAVTNRNGGNYFVADCSTTFTILKAQITPTVSIDGWMYGEAANTPTVVGNIGNGAVTYYYYDASDAETPLTAVPTEVGDYLIKATIGETTNTYGATTELLAFSISPKSIGDGNMPADDITIELTADGTLSAVKQGENTLVEDTDYTYSTEKVGDDNFFIITGIGNYTGSAKGVYACPEFTDPDGTGSEVYTAAYMASRDYAKPAGITPYIVRQVNPSIGTLVVSPLAEEADDVYIPESVPVLLLSDTEVSGFMVSPKDEAIPEISEGMKNSNLLKVAPEEGVTVEAAQVYIFYKGEFVLTKAGKITKGKFYLCNPNYKTEPRPIEDIEEEPGAAPSYGSLRIVGEESTGISDTTRLNDNRQMTNEKWYTLDGRLLSGKPTKKGIYIKNARKVIIK